MKTTKRLASALTAGLLTVSLTACGGDDADTTTDGGSATGSAASQDTGAGASSGDAAAAEDVKEGEEITPEAFVAMLKAPGEDKLKSYDMTMKMGGGQDAMEATGTMNLAGDKPAMDLEMTMPGMGEAHMIMAEGRLFMSMPGLTEEGKFVEVPADQAGDLSAIEDLDVTTMWDDWATSAEKIVFVGEEDVDGTTMKKYEVTTNAEAAADAMGATMDPALASAAPSGSVTNTIWLDEDGFMRKVEGVVPGTDGAADSTLEMTMDNWGADKTVEVPAEGDIQSMDDLMGGLSESLSTEAP